MGSTSTNFPAPLDDAQSPDAMPEHSPEPWVDYAKCPDMFFTADGTEYSLTTIRSKHHHDVLMWQEMRDVRRIVACVNACKGIPTKALEDGEAVVSRKLCSHAQLETCLDDSGHAFTFVRHIDAVTSHDCEVCRLLAAKEERDAKPTSKM